MNIVTYATPGAFLADNQAYLRDHEVEAQLNLGNAVAHREEPCGPELLFGKVEEQGRAVLLFGYLVPWNLCLDDVAHSDSGVQAARELALWLKAQEIVVPGVNGRQVLCEAFLQVWGSAYELRIAMDAMVLRRLHAPLPKGGALRLAVPEDEEVAAPWIAAFQQEAGHRELPLEMAGKNSKSVWKRGRSTSLKPGQVHRCLWRLSAVFCPMESVSAACIQSRVPEARGTAKRRWPCYASVSWARGMSMSLYSWTKQTRFPTGRIRKSVLRLWKIIATTG